jgi:hypothetical protein
MLRILSSTADAESKAFRASPRRGREDNVAWLGRHLGPPGQRLRSKFDRRERGKTHKRNPTLLVLLGGRGHYGFRLRVAQSHLRHDFSPSHWSHVALLGTPAKNTAMTPTYEIALEPRKGFGMPASSNSLQEGRIDAYRSPTLYPNIALLRLEVDPEEWQKETTKDQLSVLERYKKQRSTLDATELVLQWLAFLWGVGRAGNPLLEGYGVPSAAMIEVILSAVRYDITPGLESRVSCPEAIWQTAKWWHTYYTEQKKKPMEGYWSVSHKIEV